MVREMRGTEQQGLCHLLPAVTNPEPTVDDSPHTPQTEVLPQQAGANQQVMTEQRSLDEEEESKVRAFTSSGCGCTLLNKGPCSALFSREHYATMRADAAALTWSELNMVVMGEVMALTVMETTNHTTLFQHHGHHVCRTCFCMVSGSGSWS